MNELAVTRQRTDAETIWSFRDRTTGEAESRLGDLLSQVADWCADYEFPDVAKALRDIDCNLSRPAHRLRRSIYFIQLGREPIVKIGISTDALARLGELQVASPADLRVLALLPGNARVESGLHLAFAKFAIRGEWFRLTAPVLKLIELGGLPPQHWRAREDDCADEWDGIDWDGDIYQRFIGSRAFSREEREELMALREQDPSFLRFPPVSCSHARAPGE
jgi:hypothetical protein